MNRRSIGVLVSSADLRLAGWVKKRVMRDVRGGTPRFRIMWIDPETLAPRSLARARMIFKERKDAK